jgi:hypothetical protein
MFIHNDPYTAFNTNHLWIILGWALCREEGRAIADLAARDDKPLDGFGIFGIVKEVGVDDEGAYR